MCLNCEGEVLLADVMEELGLRVVQSSSELKQRKVVQVHAARRMTTSRSSFGGVTFATRKVVGVVTSERLDSHEGVANLATQQWSSSNITNNARDHHIPSNNIFLRHFIEHLTCNITCLQHHVFTRCFSFSFIVFSLLVFVVCKFFFFFFCLLYMRQ